MIEYRRAVESDIDELARIRVIFLAETNSNISEDANAEIVENTKRYLSGAMKNDSFAAWLAVDDGKIVATSGVTFYLLLPGTINRTGKSSYISNMFTYPEYRGRGIASKLLALVVSEARERGCGYVFLTATDMGKPVYEKFGFEDAANEMIYRIT